MKTKRHIGWVGAAMLVAVGCGSSSTDEAPAPSAKSQGTLLRRAGSCEELGELLRSDAEQKIDSSIDGALKLLDDPTLSPAPEVAKPGGGGSSGAGGAAGAGGSAGSAGLAGAAGSGGAAGAAGSPTAAGGASAGGSSAESPGGSGGSNSGGLASGGSSTGTGGSGPPDGTGGSSGPDNPTGGGGAENGAGGSATTAPGVGAGGSGATNSGSGGSGASFSGSAGSNPGKGESGGAGGSSPTADSAGGKGGAPAHSDTTTQVDGVDEADIVKTDGNYLYILHGRRLVRVAAWPVSQLAAAGDEVIEGKPLEMFLAGDRVIVFSQVASKVLEQAGSAPRGFYQDAYAADLVATAQGNAPQAAAPEVDPREQLTKVTVLTLAGGAPQAHQEVYFEGAYASARRVGASVRVVLNGKLHGPTLPAPKAGGTAAEQRLALEQLRETSKKLLAQTPVEAWLPSTMTRQGNAASVSQEKCSDVYMPADGSTELGLVRVESLDLESGAINSASVIGRAEAIYGDQDSVFIAARGYVDPVAVRGGLPAPSLKLGGIGTGAAPEQVVRGAVQGADPSATPLDVTYIHQFDFDKNGGPPVHVATGGLVGTVKNQFSLDRRDGYLRVVTSEKRQPASSGKPGPVELATHVFTFAPDEGTLVLRGNAGPIALGETVSSTRFVGSYGFLETTGEQAPLQVFDLTDPAHPERLGAVAIPGFGEFMQPLDGSHLLTIGRAGSADDPGALALRIVDVSDVLNPKISLPEVKFGSSQYGYSAAETDQKALALFADRGLLAIPYVGQNGSDIRSSLEVFRVSTVTGITQLGSIDHSALFAEMKDKEKYCDALFPRGIRRGLFIENFVYSISYAGVVVNDVDRLLVGDAKPAATLSLSAPEPSEGACPTGSDAPPPGTGGAAGAGGSGSGSGEILGGVGGAGGTSTGVGVGGSTSGGTGVGAGGAGGTGTDAGTGGAGGGSDSGGESTGVGGSSGLAGASGAGGASGQGG